MGETAKGTGSPPRETAKGTGSPPRETAKGTGSPPRQRVWSGSPWEPVVGFCRALRVGNRVIVAGTAPVPPAGEAVADSAYEQMLRCGAIALGAMAKLGASAGDVVRTRMYVTDASDAEAVGRAHQKLFREASPVTTMVVVAGLLDPAWKVEIEVEAVVE